jgi:hypothetical protein
MSKIEGKSYRTEKTYLCTPNEDEKEYQDFRRDSGPLNLFNLVHFQAERLENEVRNGDAGGCSAFISSKFPISMTGILRSR